MPKELKEKLISAVFSHSLEVLKNYVDKVLGNSDIDGSIKNLLRLGDYTWHHVAKMTDAGQMFTDISEDYYECYRINKVVSNAFFPTTEEKLREIKPLVEKLTLHINSMWNKYSNDERFSHDPYKLVAEIREDVAKYKAERFPS